MRPNILLKKRVIPQNVDLPNKTLFVLGYERISRQNLPAKVTVARPRTIRLRNKRTARTTK